jgi:hypothetical protein
MRKKLGWVFCAIGVGGSLMFPLCVLHFGPPPRTTYYFWPAATLVMALVSIRDLRHSYRIAPAAGAGNYQLGIADMMACSLLIAAMLFTMLELIPDLFVIVGVPLTFCVAATFVGGLLLAAKRSLGNWQRRYLFALSFMLRVLGGMGIGAMTAFLVAVFVFGDSSMPMEVLAVVFFLRDASAFRSDFFVNIFRISLVAFPLGIACDRAMQLRAE